MAPRRGGSGGGGSVSVECSSYAFATYYSKVLIAFVALFFVFYIVLAWFIPGTKKRRALNGGHPPRDNGRWVTLGWCISLEIIMVLLWAAWLIMAECGSNSYDPVVTAQDWISVIALLCLWGVILIPACKALHEVSGSLMPKFVTICHSVFFGWLVILEIVWVSLYTATKHGYGLYNSPADMVKATNAIYVTVTVFGLVGMLMASASMIQALSRSAQLNAGSLKLRVYALSFASIGFSVLDLAFFVHFTYTSAGEAWTESEISKMMATSLANTFLVKFFFGLMFISAVFVLKDPRVISGSATPPTNASPAAPNPVYQQQQQQNMQQYPTGYHSVPVYDPNQGANHQTYQSYPGQPPQGPTYYQH